MSLQRHINRHGDHQKIAQLLATGDFEPAYPRLPPVIERWQAYLDKGLKWPSAGYLRKKQRRKRRGHHY